MKRLIGKNKRALLGLSLRVLMGLTITGASLGGLAIAGLEFKRSQADENPGPLENPQLALALLQPSDNDASTSFIQMSDTQLGMMGKPLLFLAMGWSWRDDYFKAEAKNFETAIYFSNKANPSFVIICGDLVHARDHKGQITEFKRISALLKPNIPLYLVSGNHDVDNNPSEESLAYFRDTFGPDWYSFQHNDIYGIVLNSSLIYAPEGVANEELAQRTWLATELQKANTMDAKHIIVFQHHPYNISDDTQENSEDPDEFPKRKLYLDLFLDHGVEAVMTGHLHDNVVEEYKSMAMITTGAVGMPSPYGDSRSGLRVVKTDGEGMHHAFIALKDL
mgnify:FL=1